jgi:hypothetical protein
MHQIGDDASHHADDGEKKARSPGRTKELVKTIARGMPGETGVTCVLFIFARETAGAASRPAFLASSDFEGRKIQT